MISIRISARRRGRSVFAGELRRRAFEPLLLPLEPRLARPCALQRIADLDGEAPQALRFQLDRVAVLEGAEAAVVRPAGEDVARLERVDRAHPFDAARDL